ncbi:hypothetical protein AB4Y95_02215 [Arthrobacter sp. M-10]|uniref:hypothetical protein n=1 Tax=Arthrobacter sp. M-10 TaxID=3233037 RepID=UPI003F8D9380
MIETDARPKILDSAATAIEQLAIQIIKEEEPLQHRLFRSIMRIPPVRRFSAAVKYSPAMLSQRSRYQSLRSD